MKILAIETSCDETSAAITNSRKILTNVIFSQINIHKKYGGVYPTLAKRAHQEKIDPVVKKTLKNCHLKMQNIDAVAVTFGPGLVVSLEVGVKKAKELAKKYKLPLIPVDHTEGHIFSAFAQNQAGNPKKKLCFPFLSLVVSGGQTSLILVKDYSDYKILGSTLDDAAGEALDKAAKMLGLSYPGGPIIEELAKTGQPNFLELPIPMRRNQTLNFSYSGLKTAFKYKLREFKKQDVINNLPNLAASFQKTVFDSIIIKLQKALKQTKIKKLSLGGGVMNNKELRYRIRKLCKQEKVQTFFPYTKKLYSDNAGMIGIVAGFKYKKGIYLKDNFDKLDRIARPYLKLWMK